MTKAQLKSVVIPKMSEQLQKLGWYPVRNKKSGCLFKNGCILTFGSEYLTETKYEIGCVPDVKHNYTESDTVTRNGWMIEKDGYLLAMDSIPASVVKALSTEQYFEDQVILSLLKRINRYADMSYTELVNIRMNRQLVESIGTANILQEYNGQLRDTMMIRCCEDSDKLESGYYKIVAADDNSMTFVKLEQKEDYTLMLKGEKIRLATSEIVSLFKGGVAKVAAFAAARVPVYKELVAKVTSYECKKIPNEFYNLGLSNRQLELLGYAVSKVANVIPLLGKSTSCSYEFADVLAMTRCDLGRLLDNTVSVDSESLITNILVSGLNLNRFISDEKSVIDSEMVKMMLYDFERDFEDFRISSVLNYAAMDVQSTEDEKYAKIIYSYGEAESSFYKGIDGYADFYGKRNGITDIITTIKDNGVRDKTGYHILIDSLERSKIFAFFAIPGAMVNDAVCWNDLLQKFINEAQYVEWSAENGLMLKTIYGNLGRDDNGVIFFYSNGRPRLRSITLKDSKDGYEKTFFYGEDLLLSNICNISDCSFKW